MTFVVSERLSSYSADIRLAESMILHGDAQHVLSRLPRESVQCVVTSPPYWGLRDYDIEDQIGLEPTLPQFINRLIAVFREVKRVLKPGGTFWLNVGDGYTRLAHAFPCPVPGRNSGLITGSACESLF